jgi:thiol-disulfide isomerase/thioredoxin
MSGPTNEKAKKTFAAAEDWAKHGGYQTALEAYRKADKQDGGHCSLCAAKVVEMGIQSGDFKSADAAARELLAEATTPTRVAYAHMELGFVDYYQALLEKKTNLLAEADHEFQASMAAILIDPQLHYYDGITLAHLHQDDAARAQFEAYLKTAPPTDVDRTRAQRFLSQPELARARMAPAFSITALNGEHVSLDGLAGKVVLIDFWATWCGPCVNALPHMRELAHEFQGQPLVMISISIDRGDNADAKWRQFVAKNHMTWLQYRDASGDIARLFGVTAIPHTFTIDANGVLEDEEVGDQNIGRTLKKLCAQAEQMRESPQGTRAAAE